MKSTKIQSDDRKSLLLPEMGTKSPGKLNHLDCHAQPKDGSYLFDMIAHDQEML